MASQIINENTDHVAVINYSLEEKIYWIFFDKAKQNEAKCKCHKLNQNDITK